MSEKINTLVVGGGQAGLAMSEHLSKCDVSHLVLERSRVAERWRSGRWDSLVANGPAWHDRFPGMTFPDADPTASCPRRSVADYFVDYAKMIEAPVRCGVEVQKVQRIVGRPGFRVETAEGVIEAMNVVAATGAFQIPVVPAFVPETPGLMQIHSSAYRNPASSRKGRCWSSARAPPGSRSQTSSLALASGSIFRSARTIARRAPIASAIIAGGWACWASGISRRQGRIPNTSPSR